MIERKEGTEFHWGPFVLFFGNRFATLDQLRSLFPNLQFLRLKQVHSALVHEVFKTTPDYQIEGDAMIGTEDDLALCSISADCVPVLIASPDTGLFAAVHAGWRGVASRIVPLAIEKLTVKGANPEHLRIWIGPHILQDSFEVQEDTLQTLLQSLPPEDLKPGAAVQEWDRGFVSPASATLFCYEQDGKFRVSLLQILLEQISAMGIPLENVEMELEDTLTNENFNSYRRQKERAGRQISWIARASAGNAARTP